MPVPSASAAGHAAGETEGADSIVRKIAYVDFTSDKAASTALLLTNALVNDVPIVVETWDLGAQTLKVVDDASPGGTGRAPIDPNNRTNASVIASVVVAGYKVGTSALDEAIALDRQMKITDTVVQAAHQLREQSSAGYKMLHDYLSEVDKQYGLSTAVQDWSARLQANLVSIDETLGVTSSVKRAGQAVVDLDSQYKVTENARVLRDSSVHTVTESEIVKNATELASVAKERAIAEAFRVASLPVVKNATEVVTDSQRKLTDLVTHEVDEVRRAVDEARLERRRSREMPASDAAASDASAAEASAADGAVSEEATPASPPATSDEAAATMYESA